MEFDSPLLEETVDSLQKKVVEWINLIYGKYNTNTCTRHAILHGYSQS